MRSSHIFILGAVMAACAADCAAQAVIGEMFASDASVRGSVLFASGGTQIQSGSSVSAGDAAAVLELKRGGEVRICPKTSVSVASSASGRDLLWGMNTGAIEAHFRLESSADTVMTPDLRILLAGPGIFHFAISSNERGDACVKALASNTASLIVSELTGDGTYQVKPNEQIVFRGGRVANADALVPPECGCPPPEPPVQRANVTPPVAVQSQPKATAPQIAFYPPPPLPFASAVLSATPPIPPEVNAHLQMEAPFVYQAGNTDREMEYTAARLRLIQGSSLPEAKVNPPAKPETTAPAAKAEGKKEKKGFFGKLGSFFASIFK